MRPVQRKLFQWILFFFSGIMLFMVVYDWFPKMKIQAMVNDNTIFDSVSFHYSDEFSVSMLDSSHKMRYVYLPSFADLSEIKVEIENARVDFKKEGRTISAYKNQENICSFEVDKEYAMIFYDDRNNKIAETNVCFMKSANLSTIYISTQSGNFDKIDADKAYSEASKFSFVTKEGTVLHSNMNAKISARGNHSFGYEKKSYQFDLEQPCNLLDMGEAATWIILSNSYDLTNLRNKITYDMAASAEMEGSPKSEFVDVYLNDIYHGTYLLTEKIEFGKNRLEYNDLESSNILLNGTNLNSYKSFNFNNGEQKGYLLPEEPVDITGGYLLEHDYGNKYDEESSGFKTKSGECYVIKNPKHATISEVQYISALFQEIEDAVKSESGYNEKTGKHYSEYIDMKSWADKYIIEEFSKNQGGGCTSSYFYKLPDEVSEKVYGGPIWDYDKAYGRLDNIFKSTNDLDFMMLHSDYTKWFYYLYQHEDFREMVKYEYQNVFAPYIENELCAEIDTYAMLLQDSLKMNFERFEEMYKYGIEVKTDIASYENEIELLKSFISLRKTALDEIWINEAEICIIRFEGTSGNDRYIAIRKGDKLGTFSSETDTNMWVNKKDGQILKVGMVVDEDITATLVK